MSGPASRKGLSLWPKLLLWGAVILVGVLYLGSVNKHEYKDQDQAKGATVQTGEAATGAAESITPPPAEAGSEATRAEAAASAQPTEGPGAADQVPAADKTNSAAEQPAAAVSESTSGPAPQIQRLPATATAPEAVKAGVGAPPVVESAEGVQGGNETPTDVTPAEAKAFAEAVMSEGEDEQQTPEAGGSEVSALPAPQTPAPPAEAMPAAPADISPITPAGEMPAVAAPPAPARAPTVPAHPVQPPVPAAPPRQPPVQETMEERRSRIISEYEAMRRRADEEMRQRWEQRGMPAPYGYPGYAPGYYPQRPQ